MKKNPIVWCEIYVDDMDRATKFYETVFDTTLEEMPMPPQAGSMQMRAFPMGEVPANASAAALVKMDGMKAGGAGTVVYFNSENGSIEEARIVKAGGNVIQEKMDIGEYGFAVMASDTEGNVFGIHSMK